VLKMIDRYHGSRVVNRLINSYDRSNETAARALTGIRAGERCTSCTRENGSDRRRPVVVQSTFSKGPGQWIGSWTRIVFLKGNPVGFHGAELDRRFSLMDSAGSRAGVLAPGASKSVGQRTIWSTVIGLSNRI